MDDRVVTIFGTSHAEPGQEVYSLATDIGRRLAQAGFTIANGGYGGTMLAAAEAAAGVGGRVLGVTCSVFKRSAANAFVTEEIVTASLDERLRKLVSLGKAYVVLPGGTGTLLELAMVWELKNKGFMDPARPVVLAGRFWEPLVALMAKDDPRCTRWLIQAPTSHETLSAVIRGMAGSQRALGLKF